MCIFYYFFAKNLFSLAYVKKMLYLCSRFRERSLFFRDNFQVHTSIEFMQYELQKLERMSLDEVREIAVSMGLSPRRSQSIREISYAILDAQADNRAAVVQAKEDAREAAGTARRGPAPRRRQVARRGEADDASHDSQRGAHAQGAVGGGAGVHHEMARRGHDKVHQAVVPSGAHEAAGLPAAEEHGGACRGCGVLRGGLARQEGEARRARQARRKGLAQNVRGAGVLLLRNRGRPPLALRAPREVARMEVPARGMRRLADGVRAADGMTALAFAAKHTPKTLRSPQKRARPSEGSVAFPKGGDIPACAPH